MAKYPYQILGSFFDRLFRNGINENFKDIEEDFKDVQTQIDKLVVEGDSSPQAALAAIDAKGVDKGTLKKRLDDDYNELTEQISEKATNSDLTNGLSLKRDKATKLAMEDMDDTVVSAMTGGATVNVLSIPQDDSVTLDRINNPDLMLGYVKGQSLLNLPFNDAGNFEVELAAKGNVYVCNGNLIDIVGMQDGTYQANGLTITVVGNRITITGTSTVNQYFKLSSGTGFVPGSTGLNVRNYPLPLTDKYTFGVYDINNSGYDQFSINIRSTVSGNYATISIPEVTPYDELTDLTKFGEIYLFLNAATYNCSFSMFLSPTAYDANNVKAPSTTKINNVSKTRISSNGMILSTVAGTAYRLVNIYDSLNSTQQNDDVSNKIFVESHTSYFYYYIKGSNKDSNKYLKYTFEYWEGANNGKGWVLGPVYAVEYNEGIWTTLFPVVTVGEWEMALRIVGRPDFIGCKQHGSELNFYEKFYIDGINWVPDESSFYCKEIKIVEKSNMYDPADEVTQVGAHRKFYTITKDEVNIKQRIDWVAALTMGKDSYVAMIPILRGNDATTTYQITAKAFNDDTYEEIDVSSGSHGGRTELHNPNKWTLYSNSTGVSVSLENKPKVKTDGAYSFVQNTVDKYNKIYFGYCGDNFPVAIGDVWEIESIYKLDINL
jgi:hypothetical protein